jgi:hypothetical protein
MGRYAAFSSSPTTDPGGRSAQLPRLLTITLLVTDGVDGGRDVTHFGGWFASPPPPSTDTSWLARLANIRSNAVGAAVPGGIAPGFLIFEIEIPDRDITSLKDLSGELCGELVSRWPSLAFVVTGTPTRGYRSHQVLMVASRKGEYREAPATANDTLVIVGTEDGPLGVLRTGAWQDAQEDCSWYDAAEVCGAYLSRPDGSLRPGTAFLALVLGEEPPHEFCEVGLAAQACSSLSQHLWNIAWE